LVEMVPKSSLKNNQMLTPAAALQVKVINVPVETPRAPSLRRPTCLELLNRQTKRHEHSYDICKEESQEDADGEFTCFALVCETGREYLTTSQLWDRSVREGEKLVIEIMEEVSVELFTGFTRIINFFRFDAIEIMLTDICDAKEAGRGSLASFRTAIPEAVGSLYDDEASACNFYDVYVKNKLVEDVTLSWHAIRAPNKPRVRFILKDSVASFSTAVTRTVNPTDMTHNGPSINARVNFTTATATSVNPNVGDQLVAEGLPIVGAQTAAYKSHCDVVVVTSSVLQKVLFSSKEGAPLPQPISTKALRRLPLRFRHQTMDATVHSTVRRARYNVYDIFY